MQGKVSSSSSRRVLGMGSQFLQQSLPQRQLPIRITAKVDSVVEAVAEAPKAVEASDVDVAFHLPIDELDEPLDQRAPLPVAAALAREERREIPELLQPRTCEEHLRVAADDGGAVGGVARTQLLL